MSALTNLRDVALADIVGITDAAYPGDPAGTPANKDYFTSNVHNYLKILGQLALPSDTYIVSPAFTTIDSPYSPTIQAAVSAISGSSSSNKKLVEVLPNGSSYAETLSFSNSQWIVIQGKGKYSVAISGAISITNGVVIFRGVDIKANISVAGGVAIFEDCTQTDGVFAQTGGTVIISNCGSWGHTSITGNGNILFLEGIKSIKKGTGGDALNSITFQAGISTGTYCFTDVRCEGLISNPSSVVPEISNVKENGAERPAY